MEICNTNFKKTNFKKKTKIKNHSLISALEPIGLVGLIIPWNYPFIVSCERLPLLLLQVVNYFKTK